MRKRERQDEVRFLSDSSHDSSDIKKARHSLRCASSTLLYALTARAVKTVVGNLASREGMPEAAIIAENALRGGGRAISSLSTFLWDSGVGYAD